MLVETGSTIPKGYIVEITSYEGDADDYRVVRVNGLTKVQAKFLTDLSQKFKPFHVDNNTFGNKEYDSKIFGIIKELAAGNETEIASFTGFSLESADVFEDYEVLHFLYDHLLHEPVDEELAWYCRVVDKVRVFFLEDDYVVPEFKPTEVQL